MAGPNNSWSPLARSAAFTRAAGAGSIILRGVPICWMARRTVLSCWTIADCPVLRRAHGLEPPSLVDPADFSPVAFRSAWAEVRCALKCGNIAVPTKIVQNAPESSWRFAPALGAKCGVNGQSAIFRDFLKQPGHFFRLTVRYLRCVFSIWHQKDRRLEPIFKGTNSIGVAILGVVDFELDRTRAAPRLGNLLQCRP